MKKTAILVCLTTLPAIAWGAAAPAPAATPAVTLKQQSSFPDAKVRNPFWPIGWTKPAAVTGAPAVAAPALSPASFTLSSVTMGAGARFAILNGKVVQEGQQIGLQFGSQLYQVTVRAIEDGQVILTSQGGEIIVPLRRH